MAQTLTRQQFYDLVWSKPMTHLAKEFGISDVALHKICRKHNIPNPPLGWWAKKAAGKKVRQTPLPEAEADATQSITLADPELRNEPPGIAAAREQARIAASATPADSDLPRVPIIERTLARLEKAKPSEVGISTVDGPGLIKCSVAPSSTYRLGIIPLDCFNDLRRQQGQPSDSANVGRVDLLGRGDLLDGRESTGL